MNLRDILGDSEEFKDNRTQQSVAEALMMTIVREKRISGNVDATLGLIKLAKEQIQKPEFAEALDRLAKFALEIFPVKNDDEK